MMPKGDLNSPKRRRNRVVRRRRQNFERLVAGAGATLILGLIPGLRFLWAVHLVLDMVLVAYVLQLRRWKMLEQQRARVVRELPAEDEHERLVRSVSEIG